MLNRYREVDKCKEDINQFSEMVLSEIQDVSENDMVAIAKGMSFLKKVYVQGNQSQKHYYNCLLTDMFSLLYFSSKKSVKIFYTFQRSLMENLVRVILGYEENDSTGIRNMFNEFHTKYDAVCKTIIDYFEGEYGKCCAVVHSNITANLPMYEYYEEIIKEEQIRSGEMGNLFRQLANFYKKCQECVIAVDCMRVEEAFNNQKEVLYYLLGKRLYQLFEKKSEEVWN